MRSALVLALLLAAGLPGCGGGNVPEMRARHVVVTTAVAGSVEDLALKGFVDDRHATLIRFSDLKRDLAQITLELRRLDPAFVTVVLKGDQLDVNAAYAFYEAAASLDPDPFADFLYGFVPYDNAKTIERFVKSVRIADFKREKLLIAAAVYESAGENAVTKEALPWASGLQVTTLRVKPDDWSFVKANNTHVELANLLLFNGPVEPAGELKLESQVVVAAVAGAASTVPARAGATALPYKILHQGAVAILGSLDSEGGAAVARAEFDRLVAAGLPLGAVVKASWDEAILALGGRATLPRREPGRPEPPEVARHPREYGAMARVLIGDPSLEPFSRRSSPALAAANSFEKMDASNNVVTVATFVVDQPAMSSAFLDPYTLDNGVYADRVHIVVDLPAVTREAVADLASSELDGAQVAARVNAQAFESFAGRCVCHLLVGGAPEALRKKGLTFTVNVRRR
jgi:hypothetical protein